MCKLEASNVQVQEISDDSSDEAGSDSTVYVPSGSDHSDEGTLSDLWGWFVFRS